MTGSGISTHNKTHFDFSNSVIKNRKLKIILRLSFWFLIFMSFGLAVFRNDFSFLLATLFTISLFGQIVTYLLTSRYYNWPLILFMVVIIGILFKRQHWPFSGTLMALGTLILAVVSTINSVKFMKNRMQNIFLKWFGTLSGIIVILFMTGLLFMNQHWSGIARAILIYSGCFLFFLTILGMIFTLPFSNYVSWSDIERKVFYRTIIIPMVFILLFFILVFVFPDTYNSLLGRNVHFAPWIYQDSLLELKKLEGIPVIQ